MAWAGSQHRVRANEQRPRRPHAPKAVPAGAFAAGPHSRGQGRHVGAAARAARGAHVALPAHPL